MNLRTAAGQEREELCRFASIHLEVARIIRSEHPYNAPPSDPGGTTLTALLARHATPDFPLGLLLDLDHELRSATPLTSPEVRRPSKGSTIEVPLLLLLSAPKNQSALPSSGAVRYLTLEWVPRSPSVAAATADWTDDDKMEHRGRIYPSPEVAFQFRDRDWKTAVENAAAFLHHEGLWEQEGDLRYRVKKSKRSSPTDDYEWSNLLGDSAGAILALAGAALLAPGSRWAQVPFPSLAVTAAIDPEGTLQKVGGYYEKLAEAARLRAFPKLRYMGLEKSNYNSLKGWGDGRHRGFTEVSEFEDVLHEPVSDVFITTALDLLELREKFLELHSWSKDAPRILQPGKRAEQASPPEEAVVIKLDADAVHFLRSSQLGNPVGESAKAMNGISQKSQPQLRREQLRQFRNRATMLDRVDAYWIKGVLEQALNEANQFHVGFELAPDAVLKRWDLRDVIISGQSDFSRVFTEVGSEVLILGLPGSGKTIMLLQLARSLLESARQDPSAPIPLVLNLSTWGLKQLPLDEWIVSDAALNYQVPRKAIRHWLDEGLIIPLLDGLDEVGLRPEGAATDRPNTTTPTDHDRGTGESLEMRSACLDAIETFHHSRPEVKMAVCSRREEYDQLNRKLDLRAAVIQMPMDDRQIEAVVMRPSLAGLYLAMQCETWLRTLADTPLLLNAMCYAYDGLSEAQLRLPADDYNEKGRRDHILDAYITRRLEATRAQRFISAFRLRSLLMWLASKMVARGQTIFHIESIQMDMLSKFDAKWIYCVFSRVAFASLVVAFGQLIWIATDEPLAKFLETLTTNTETLERLNKAAGEHASASIILPLFFFLLAGYVSAMLEWAHSAARLLSRTFRLLRVWAGWSLIAATVAIIVYLVMPQAKLEAFAGPVRLDASGGQIVRNSGAISAPMLGFFKKLLVSAAAFFGLTALIIRGVTLIQQDTLGVIIRRKLSQGSGTFPRIAAAVKKAHEALGGVTIHYLATGTVLTFVISLSAGSSSYGTSREEFTLAFVLISFGVICMTLFSSEIQTTERLDWRWKWGSFSTWALAGLATLLSMQWGFDQESEPIPLDALLLFCSACGLFGATVFGFRRSDSLHRRIMPNQGVVASVKTGLKITFGFLVGGYLMVFLSNAIFALFKPREDYLHGIGEGTVNMLVPFSETLIRNVHPAIGFGVFMAGIGAMIGGFDVPVKHWVLRVLLWLTEGIPLRLQRFLDSCTRLLLLRRAGGGYIFPHRLLLERFAELAAREDSRE